MTVKLLTSLSKLRSFLSACALWREDLSSPEQLQHSSYKRFSSTSPDCNTFAKQLIVSTRYDIQSYSTFLLLNRSSPFWTKWLMISSSQVRMIRDSSDTSSDATTGFQITKSNHSRALTLELTQSFRANDALRKALPAILKFPDQTIITEDTVKRWHAQLLQNLGLITSFD